MKEVRDLLDIPVILFSELVGDCSVVPAIEGNERVFTAVLKGREEVTLQETSEEGNVIYSAIEIAMPAGEAVPNQLPASARAFKIAVGGSGLTLEVRRSFNGSRAIDDMILKIYRRALELSS